MRQRSVSRRIATALAPLFLLSAAPTAAQTIHANETITSNVTWTAAGNDHIVTGSLSVSSTGTLTIEDGCTVRFDHAASMSISGTLNAPGSAGILFTRRDMTDQWGGIRFNSGSSGTLEDCTIQYATYGTGYGVYANNANSVTVTDCTIRSSDYGVYANSMLPSLSGCTIEDNTYGVYITNIASPDLSSPNVIQNNASGGVWFTGCSNPSISNQTISGVTHQRGAIYMEGVGEFHIGTGNVVTGNSWGLTMKFDSYPDLASIGNFPVAGNTNSDGIQLWGGSVNTAIPWRLLDVNYIITSSPSVAAGGNVTVDDGLTLYFDNGTSFSVSGTLNAVGTSGNGITFTRRTASDAWGGLRFNTNANGNLENCTVEYATYGTGYALYASSANSVTATDCLFHQSDYGVYANSMLPSLSGCTIEDNTYGVYITNIASPDLSSSNVIQNNPSAGVWFTNCSNPSISNQTITGVTHQRGAIYMEGVGEFHIGTGNVVTGNSWGLTMKFDSYPDLASIGNFPVAGNTNSDGIQLWGGSVNTAIPWRLLDVNYIITSSPSIAAGGNVTVDDGLTLYFDNGTSFSVSGTLNAVGTSGNGITFTRRTASDAWGGLRFNSNSNGTLENCTVEYATYGTGYGLYASSANSVTATDCLFHLSDYGVYANSMLPSITGCTIENNTYGVYITGVTSPDLSSPNVIQNNASGGVWFTGCSNPSISNQTISGVTHQRGGIYMEGVGEFHIGTGNAVTGNSWGLTMKFDSYPDLASIGNFPVAGNTNTDGIQLWGGSVNTAIPWRLLDVNYIITSSPSVAAGGNVTIDDGLTLYFDNGTSFSVSGTLNAVGTSGNGITFTRRTASDAWGGLRFNSNSNGTLENCTVEYATYGTGYGLYASSANSVTATDCLFHLSDYGVYANSMLPSITGCTIEDNTYGVYITGVTSPDLSSPNVIQNNASGGVWFTGCSNPSISNQTISGVTHQRGGIYMEGVGEFHIGTGNVVTGNSWGLTMKFNSYPDLASIGNFPVAGNTNSDGIQLWGGSVNTAIPWRLLDVNYIITSSPSVAAGGNVTIDDGLTLYFDNGTSFSVSGTLNAVGTSGNGITFTRRTASDAWGGLRFNSNGNGNLENCTVEHATYGTGYGVYANNANSVSLVACTLHSNDYGAYANNTDPSFLHCSIVNNLAYGVYLTGTSVAAFGTSLSEWNDIHGNGSGNPDRDLRNGNEDIQASYVYWGTVVQETIEGRIRHEPDDGTLGLVSFGPWTNAAHDTEYGGSPTSVSLVTLPARFELSQARPNPVRSTTAIRYALPRDARVELSVFNVTGQKVATLVDGFQAAGFQVARWDPRGVASGVYFYRLQAGDFVQTKRLAVLR